MTKVPISFLHNSYLKRHWLVSDCTQYNNGIKHEKSELRVNIIFTCRADQPAC